jgi:hypothetical protein
MDKLTKVEINHLLIIPYQVYRKNKKITHAMIPPYFEYTACGHYMNAKNWDLEIERFIESEESCKKCVKSLKKEGFL